MGMTKRSTVDGDTDMTQQALVEDGVDDAPVVVSTFLLAPERRAIGGSQFVGAGGMGRNSHPHMMPDGMTGPGERGLGRAP